MLEPGTPIGDWVVEEPLDGSDRYRCHRRDTPFRKAVLRVVRAADVDKAREEAESLRGFQHPNIQGVIGLATSGDDLYLVTEAVVGATLDAFVREPPLPLKAAIDVAVQVADALTAAHARGIVHGDVRTGNVLLAPDGRALLVGFDLRSSLGDGTAQDDAHGFGVLLYELMTGTRVEPGPPRALSFDLDLPQALRDVLVGLTHPDPHVRCTLEAAHVALGLARRESLGESLSAETTFVDTTEAPATSSVPGQIGRYRVVREVGRGGVGVVYEATDPDLKRRVALKVLLAGTFARARDLARFRKEAQAVARLDHPAIVQILDMGTQQDAAWFAMEYVDGPTLLDHARALGRLPWREAARIGSELARALQHAHDSGLVHRDVKPNNVLLDGGIRPKLTDFGLALDEEGEQTRLTRTGQVLGTPMYMSPEQASGDLEHLGPHTDVYALGVVLYEALTGTVPYDGATPLQVIGKVLGGNARAPRELAPDLPRPLEVVVLKAMQRDIRDRYASAGALAEDLDRVLRGEPIVAAEPTLADRARWFVRRNRTPLAVGGLVLVVTLLALSGTSTIARWRAAEAAAAREEATRVSLASVKRRMEAAVAEGRPDVAEAAWQTFVRQPEHRGTKALVDGWIDRATAAASRRDGEGRLAALAAAYAAAATLEVQADALTVLARAAREEQRLDLLPLVLDMLLERAPERAPAVAGLRRDALAAHRELAAAAAHGPADDGVHRVLVALAPATRTAHRATSAAPWPGGGLLLRDGSSDRPVVVGPEPALPELRTLRLPVPLGTGPFVLPDTPPRLLGAVPRGGAVVLRVDDDRLVVEGSWPTGGISDAVSADLDGDGVVETYYGSGRELWRLRRTPEGWVHDAPDAELQQSNSQIADLDAGDVDRDGVRELVVAAAEWSAYDVRTLEPAGGVLALDVRRKLGVVPDLAVLPGPDGRDRVLASKIDAWPNLRVFPEDAPYGEAPGVWELRFAEGRLDGQRVATFPCSGLRAADLDGDGLSDAVGQCGDDVVLWVRRPDGGLYDLRLRRLRLLAAVQLDADPAGELVVADPDDGHQVWVLGAGDGEPPYLLRTHHASEPPPPDADPAFRAAWQRAEDLVYTGQLEQAALALRELADLRWGEPSSRAALVRAAGLHAARRAWTDAADVYLVAADQGATDALAEAARALREAGEPEREREVLVRLRDAAGLRPEEAARLAALEPLAAPPVLEIGFGDALDPRWEIARPLAVRRDRGDLRVEAMGHALLARLPVEWDGGFARIEVDADVERTEWDGGLAVGLVPRGATEPVYGVRIDGRGGGEIVWRRVQCLGPERALERDVPRLDLPLVATTSIQPDGTLTCAVRQEATPGWRSTARASIDALPEGPFDLAIVSVGQSSALAAAWIRRITVTGVRVADARPAAAVTSPLAEAVARGDRDALRTLLRGDVDPADLAQLAHARLADHGEVLREALGAQWPGVFVAAWESTLHAQSSTDPAVQAVLLAELPDLERLEPPDDPLPVAWLLALRGRAATLAGRDALARACLERSQALGGPRHAALDLAVLDVRAGDADAAFARLRDAITHSPTPAVVADVVAVRQELAPLRSDPRWEEVVERVRRGG